MQNWSPSNLEPEELRANTSSRARFRNIRWPNSGEDEPEVYPLGTPFKPVRPVTPVFVPRVKLILHDKVNQVIRFGLGISEGASGPSTYKHVDEVLVVLSDKAALNIEGLLNRSSFRGHVISVSDRAGLNLNTNGKLSYQPRLILEDLAKLNVGAAGIPEILFITDKARIHVGIPGSSLVIPIALSDKASFTVSEDGTFALYIPYDSMESYDNLVLVDALNGGIDWPSGYADRSGYYGLQVYDSEEDYAPESDVTGLNLGINWRIPYVDRPNAVGIQVFDDIEAYLNGASVTGLNRGINWRIPYVDHVGYKGLQANDNMESYTPSSAVNGLNGGTGWGGPFVDR